MLSHPEPTLSNVNPELQQIFYKLIPDPVNPPTSSPEGVDSSSPEGDKVETDGNKTVPEESKPDRLTFLSPIYIIHNTSNHQSEDSLVQLCKSHSIIGAFTQYPEILNPALFTTMANKEENPTHSKALFGSDSTSFIEEIKKEEKKELKTIVKWTKKLNEFK